MTTDSSLDAALRRAHEAALGAQRAVAHRLAEDQPDLLPPEYEHWLTDDRPQLTLIKGGASETGI